MILEFSTLPTIIKNGTNTIKASVKWDDQESEEIIFNKYGDFNFIQFKKYQESIIKIKESNKMFLEFKEDGEDNIKITFPLEDVAVINESEVNFNYNQSNNLDSINNKTYKKQTVSFYASGNC